MFKSESQIQNGSREKSIDHFGSSPHLGFVFASNVDTGHSSEQWPEYTGGWTGEAKRNYIFMATSAENQQALLQKDANHIQEFLSQ